MKDPQQFVNEKTVTTGSVSPLKAQCVFPDFGSLVSSVNSVTGLRFQDADEGSLNGPSAPS